MKTNYKKINKTYSLPNCYYFRSGIVVEDVADLQRALDEANLLKAEADRLVKDAREAKRAAAQQSQDRGRLISETAMGKKPEDDSHTGTLDNHSVRGDR